jgi:uncharacterized 2Fe-2S/4Fe-4S cluster protein (DUF4445 family)
VGRRGECEAGDSLLECSRKAGGGIAGICGGKGKCGACKVRILKGNVSEPTPVETAFFSVQELGEGLRLGCQVYPSADCSVYVPPESMTTPQRTQVEGMQIHVDPDPPVRCYQVILRSPDLSDPMADADRLIRGLQDQHGVVCRKVDGEVLRTLSADLRALNWQCPVAVRGGEVIRLGSGPRPVLGLAVDLGTTKIAGYLVDLEEGKKLASRGVMNPQISFGEDVITRIEEALKSPERAGEIRKTAIEALNRLIGDLCNEADAVSSEVLEVEVACNTAMHHLLLGLPVRQLVTAPFVPAASMALECKARDLGLHIAPGAYVHVLPNVAGFVGGDHVAMLLAVDEGSIASVSCASGPAFEGYQIRHGMRAARGAIDRVRINGDSVECQTIDGAPATGICGSGVLDALAQMYVAGVIDRSGRMSDGHPRVRGAGGEKGIPSCLW